MLLYIVYNRKGRRLLWLQDVLHSTAAAGREEQHGKKTGIWQREHYLVKGRRPVCVSARQSSLAQTVWRAVPTQMFEIVSNSTWTKPVAGHGDAVNNVGAALQGRQRHRRGFWPRYARGLEQRRGALQLGAAVLRDVRGRQVRRWREDNYEFSLGLNGLGLCATQYASAWMTADIYRDGYRYHLDFKKGENVWRPCRKEPYKGRRTGSIIHWKPDDEVFTGIDVPGSYYKDVLRRQAVVNAGLYPQLYR